LPVIKSVYNFTLTKGVDVKVINVKDATHKRLKAKAKKLKMTMQEVATKAINAYLKGA